MVRSSEFKLVRDDFHSKRKADSNAKRNIDKESKKLSKWLNVEDKMESYPKRTAFITLKDHKDNFKINWKCRLINPSKGEMGIVSKITLENISSKLNSKTSGEALLP